MSAASKWHWFEVAPPVLVPNHADTALRTSTLGLSAVSPRASDGTAIVWAKSPTAAVREVVTGSVDVGPIHPRTAGRTTVYAFADGLSRPSQIGNAFTLVASHGGRVVHLMLSSDLSRGPALAWTAATIRVAPPPRGNVAAWKAAEAAAVPAPSEVEPFDVKVTDVVYLGLGGVEHTEDYVKEGTDNFLEVTVDRECHDIDTYDTPLTVGIDWTPSTAIQGVDYSGNLPTSVSWGAGDYGTKTIDVPLINDQVPEWTKTFVGQLSNLPPNVVDGSVYDSDGQPVPSECDLVDDDLNLTIGKTDLSNDPGPLTPLQLGYGDNGPSGATVTLSAPTTGAGAVTVWPTDHPTATDTPILDAQHGSITWTIGSGSEPPKTVYVRPEGGSQSVGDVVLALAASDANAIPRPNHATSTNATSQPATNTIVHLVYGGNNVDGVKADDRLVGQDVAIDASVQSPFPNPTYQWTIDGEAYKDYSLAAAPENPQLAKLGNADLTTSSTDFFWSSGGQKNVQCDVDVNGTTHHRSTLFNVTRPAVTETTTHNGDYVVNIGQNQPNWYLGTGVPSPDGGPYGQQGFEATASVTVNLPAGVDHGNWAFLQVLTPNDWIHSGNKYYYDPNNDVMCLDGNFPTDAKQILTAQRVSYTSSLLPTDGTPFTFVDSPDHYLSNSFNVQDANRNPDGSIATNPNGSVSYGPVQSVNFDEVRRNDMYDNYVMFLPPGSNSRWVPLKMVHWWWAADAKMNANGTWTLVSHTDPQANAPVDVTTPPTGWHKKWTAPSYVEH